MLDGIYLGTVTTKDGKKEVVYAKDRHLITIGPSGSGKSWLITPNAAALNKSLLIIDPKGEIAAVTAAKRAKEFGKESVKILNPFGVLTDTYPDMASCGFNPLATIDPNSETFAEDCFTIAEAFVVERPEGRDAHWVESARDLIATLIMWECRDWPKRIGTMAAVRQTLGVPHDVKKKKKAKVDDAGGIPPATTPPPTPTTEEVATLKKVLKLMGKLGNKAMRNKAERYMTGGNELLGVLAEARTQTQSLDSMRISDDLSKDGFRFEEMKERITTVYLVLPAHELEKHNRWMRLMVASALRAMLQGPESEEVGRVLFILDEFANALGTMKSIEKSVSYARGYGLQLWFILQDLTQLQNLYGKGWETFIAQRGALTAYAPQDLTTSRYLSELCGNKTEYVRTVMEDLEKGEWKPSFKAESLPLFRGDDLMTMPMGEMLCMLQGVPPRRIQVPPYWLTKYNDGLRKNPYYKS